MQAMTDVSEMAQKLMNTCDSGGSGVDFSADKIDTCCEVLLHYILLPSYQDLLFLPGP
jgi:hypothetical protein